LNHWITATSPKSIEGNRELVFGTPYVEQRYALKVTKDSMSVLGIQSKSFTPATQVMKNDMHALAGGLYPPALLIARKRSLLIDSDVMPVAWLLCLAIGPLCGAFCLPRKDCPLSARRSIRRFDQHLAWDNRPKVHTLGIVADISNFVGPCDLDNTRTFLSS
jgi:hypothetical protein